MNDDGWWLIPDSAKRIERMLLEAWVRVTPRLARLFCVACCRVVDRKDYDYNSRLRQALIAAEQFADGIISLEELAEARRGAYDAYRETAWPSPGGAGDGVQQYLAVTMAADPEIRCEISRNCISINCLAVLLHWKCCLSEDDGRNLSLVVRDLFGDNLSRPATIDPNLLTADVLGIARYMYVDRDFTVAPILADALQKAGCEDEPILQHCRRPGPHFRGCWVVDLVLGRE